MARSGYIPSPAELMAQLPPKTHEAFKLLTRELLRWNQTHNLTGHHTLDDVHNDLFLDSLALIPHIHGSCLLDIGSGAGFPGLALALALPQLTITTLEPRAKRISFQKHIVRTLGLGKRVRPIMGRTGDNALKGQLFTTVTMRALGGLENSLALARPYLEPGGSILLPRGLKDRDHATRMGLEIHEYHLPQVRSPRVIVIARP